jgi:hypothetical protein
MSCFPSFDPRGLQQGRWRTANPKASIKPSAKREALKMGW